MLADIGSVNKPILNFYNKVVTHQILGYNFFCNFLPRTRSLLRLKSLPL